MDDVRSKVVQVQSVTYIDKTYKYTDRQEAIVDMLQ